jgi:hypothetical protein
MIIYLFLQLPLINVGLLGALLQRVLEENNVLLVLLALNHDFLDLAFLLAEDLDGLSVSPLLLVQLQLQVLHAGLKLADDALATDNGVSFDLLKADRDVLNGKDNIALIFNNIKLSNPTFKEEYIDHLQVLSGQNFIQC